MNLGTARRIAEDIRDGTGDVNKSDAQTAFQRLDRAARGKYYRKYRDLAKVIWDNIGDL